MYILCSFTSSFVFGSVEPLCDLFAVAMESDIVCRIRDALHPLVFCVFPAGRSQNQRAGWRRPHSGSLTGRLVPSVAGTDSGPS